MRLTFDAPSLTDDEWEQKRNAVQEWEAKREIERVNAMMNNANIPRRYREAVPGLEVAEWIANPTVGLLLKGNVGVGKTHQACAALIAYINGARERRQHGYRSARFATFDDLLFECKATWKRYASEHDVIDRYAGTGLLCIDDFGKERATEWSLPIIFTIINKRSANLKPTIVTTQLTGKQIIERLTVDGNSETARAIVSRLSEYKLVNMTGKDRRRA